MVKTYYCYNTFFSFSGDGSYRVKRTDHKTIKNLILSTIVLIFWLVGSLYFVLHIYNPASVPSPPVFEQIGVGNFTCINGYFVITVTLNTTYETQILYVSFQGIDYRIPTNITVPKGISTIKITFPADELPFPVPLQPGYPYKMVIFLLPGDPWHLFPKPVPIPITVIYHPSNCSAVNP